MVDRQIRRPTINDVAKEAGVSKSAVSYALSGRGRVGDQTRDRVLETAARLGWQPKRQAQGLSKSRAYSVGIVFARDTSTLGADPFFAPFIAGVEQELARFGYVLVLLVNTSGETSELDDYRRLSSEGRVDGVILTDLRVEDPRMSLMEELGLPYVSLGLPSRPTSAPMVYVDEEDGVRQATTHLYDLGHRVIAHVSGPDLFIHARARRVAFVKVCKELGIQSHVVDADFSLAGGAVASRSLMALEPQPTAIVFGNSLMAIAGFKELVDRGIRVPQQMSIVSLDDNPIAPYFSPPLTAIGADSTKLGELCVRALVSTLDGGISPVSLAVRNPLIVRESTGPVSNSGHRGGDSPKR